MKMKIRYGIVAMLMILTLFLSMPMIHLPTTAKADPGTLTVPGEYPTITQAIAAASPGDTIMVSPGTYNEEVDINKAVQVLGSGAASTFINGTGLVLASAGLVKITAPGDVTFSGFTVENAPLDPSYNEFEIFSSSSTSGATYHISNNNIVGTGDTNPNDMEVGFYSQNDQANAVFKYNNITNIGGDNIVFEVHTGSTEISHNNLEAGLGGGDSTFFMTYNANTVTTLQNVSYNTFNMGTGTTFDYDTRATAVSFNTPGAAYGVSDAQFTNVVIQGNTINNLKSYRRGIGFWNGGGSGGGIIAPLVESNTITGIAGSTDSDGIDFIATGSSPIAAANATIFSNWIYNCNYGVWLRSDGCAPGAQITYNVIQNNTVGLNDTVDSSPVRALFNYWGDPTGPYNATSNPTGLGNPVDGNANYQPYLTAPVPATLSITPTPVNKAPTDVGTAFTQTVTLSQFSYFAGFDINLTWDNSLITLTTVDYTTTLNALWGTGNWTTVFEQSGAGYYELAAVALATSASNAEASALFTLTFTVAQSSNFPLSTPIHFAVVKLSDTMSNPIPTTATDGTYTMSAMVPGLEFKVEKYNKKTSAWDAVTSPYHFECGNNFTVDVYVTDVTSFTAYNLTIDFNSTLVALQTVQTWGIFGAGTVIYTAGASSVQISGLGSAWSGSEGLLFKLPFNVQFNATADHIWNSAKPNYETFPTYIAAATLSFTGGTIPIGGISTPAPLTIEIDFIRGDVLCTGVVGINDIRVLAYYYGQAVQPTGPVPPQYDLLNHGHIDIYDVVQVANNYGYGLDP
ncbi:MAG: hypothetical protein ABSB89_10220 [Candidatus Bathyarchaeia archaeon]|jgi:hypothetical protein